MALIYLIIQCKRRKKTKCKFHTNFPVENDDNIMLESSLPLIIIVLSMAEVTQLIAAICSLQKRNSSKFMYELDVFV